MGKQILYRAQDILQLDPNSLRLDAKSSCVLQIVQNLAHEVIVLRNRVSLLEHNHKYPNE